MPETFTASKGWFNRFKKFTNLHSICITGEVATADTKAVQEFSAPLKATINRDNCHPELVFNVDKTGHFWKEKMPSLTFISCEENHGSGFKAGKDWLTLLLGSYAKGDF